MSYPNNLLLRTARIHGQLGGVHRMLTRNERPAAILMQIKAARSALRSLSREILRGLTVEQLRDVLCGSADFLDLP